MIQLTESVYSDQIGYPIEMLDWNIVDEIIPNKSNFIILDIESGKYFTVQRRAGSSHADVQPLTKQDTKIMKEIYGGKWDWRRRAIIAITDTNWIAASMHGMPHGAGALNNNFPGHFCVHFYGSKTHRSNNMDLSHKLMIYKAAGKLDQFFSSADLNEIVASFIVGLKQQDNAILEKVSYQQINWDDVTTDIANIKLIDSKLNPEQPINDLHEEVEVRIDWVLTNHTNGNFNKSIHLIRTSPFEQWKIDTIRFLKESDLH